jgi:hypothetical protein
MASLDRNPTEITSLRDKSNFHISERLIETLRKHPPILITE